jgi:O-antigen ligase
LIEVGPRVRLNAEATVRSFSSPRGNVVLDLIGLAVAVALIAWTFLVARVSGGVAEPIAGLVGGCVFAYALGRILGSVGASLVPILVIVPSLVVVSLSLGDVVSSSPLSGPFGYVNAKAAFSVQAAFAALMLASVARRASVRAFAFAAAIAFALVPISSHAWTAAAELFLLPVLTFVLFRARGARQAILGCAGGFVLVLLATIALGASHSDSGRSGFTGALIRDTVSERRLTLWNEAIDLIVSHPSAGVGPGRFQVESRIARSDSDARWAHHEFLQMGAETGLVGLALLLSLFLWGFARLWAGADDSWLAALGAGALAALGIHACVDYVLHFPAIVLGAAALVGSATGASRDHIDAWGPFARRST